MHRTFHCPSYRSPLAHAKVPDPLNVPARHSPSYSSPLANTYLQGVLECSVASRELRVQERMALQRLMIEV